MKYLDVAEAMYAMGANVLPIKNGKKPYIEWDRLQTERQSLEELKSFDWDACTGLGIVCGINGYVCIDLDKMKTNEAVISFLKVLGLNESYSWRVKSGSKTGEHIWVRVTTPLPFDKGVVFGKSKDGSFDHLEIRWKECQTLIPPSVHVSGNVYEWVNGQPVIGPHEVSVDAIINAFESCAYLKTDDPNNVDPKYKKTEYSEIIANGVSEGMRNDKLASLAGHYKKLGMEYSEAVEVLKLWNSRLIMPMLVNEVESTLTSIYSYPSTDIVLRTGMEMSLMATPILNDIVDGIIGERSFNFLAGEEGGGKSLLAMNLALSIATGKKDFLGFPIKKYGKVLYLNNELPFPVFLNRFKTMRTSLSKDELAKMDNFLTPEYIKPIKESWDDITKLIVTKSPVLLILDCFYWAHDKKENDSSEMKEIMRKLVALRDQFGIAVLVVHHTKKGVRHELMHNDDMRGSQVFSASADSTLQLRRSAQDGAQRIFKPTKLRNGTDENQKARLLELNGHNLWFSDKGIVNEEDHIAVIGQHRDDSDKKIDWKVIFGAAPKLKRKDIVERCKGVGMSDRTVDRKLDKAVDDKVLRKSEYGEYEIIGNDSPTPPAIQ
jgi:hypothetical protein